MGIQSSKVGKYRPPGANGMPLAVVFRNRAVKPVCVKTTGDDAPTP
jgi:hypothetical protein